MSSSLTTLLLARHGQVQANVDRRWHGSTDSELTATGHEQAARLAEYIVRTQIPVDAIYTSPLQRARQTAAPVARAVGIMPIIMEQLREFGIGVLENTPYQDLMEREHFYRNIARDNHYAPEGGESVVRVAERMVESVEIISARHPGESVLIVSHGAAMAILLSQLLEGRAFPFHDYHCRNTAITKVLRGQRFELAYFDQTLHLETENEESAVDAGAK